MKKSHSILLVEDEANLSFFLNTSLTAEGYAVAHAPTLAAARRNLASALPDAILLDVQLPDGSGIDLLSSLKKEQSDIPVIIMTAFGSINQAITAIKIGAVDYLQKPFDLEELKIRLANALNQNSIQKEIRYLKTKEDAHFDSSYWHCRSTAMQGVYDLAGKVAESSDTPVLIEGESGTGKEMIARMIHRLSPRQPQSIVDINCASIPESLLESELFGYEAGAFTDAKKRKAGLLEVAHGGTLVLDEISEMPLSIQSKLLRALETQTVRRLGGIAEIRSDFRFIAITNRNLKELVRTGQFREDLYFRLRVVPITVPPLRNHRDDLPDLVQFFLQKCIMSLHRELPVFSEDAQQRILDYHWPGNIRELRNVIERAVILSKGREINELDLHLESPVNYLDQIVDLLPEGVDLNLTVEAIKEAIILKALAKTGQNQVRAAELLHIPRHVIRYFLEKRRTPA